MKIFLCEVEAAAAFVRALAGGEDWGEAARSRTASHERVVNAMHLFYGYESSPFYPSLKTQLSFLLLDKVQGDWTGCRDYEAWQEVTFIWQTYKKWLVLGCI